MDTRDPTPYELMVIAASREIRDYELVFVGMRLPLLAFNLAKSIHAPNAVGLFEAGLMREKICMEYTHTMCDLPFQTNASWLTGLLEVMACLQRGEVDVGIIGGAQIDKYGNVNSTLVNIDNGRKRRLPGSGGACDIAVFSKRLIVMMPMERRRIKEKVDYITSPGVSGQANRHISWRRGEVILITDKAVFKTSGDGELRLHAIYPNTSLSEITEEAGPIMGEKPEELKILEPPTEKELEVLRKLDREGFWTRRGT